MNDNKEGMSKVRQAVRWYKDNHAEEYEQFCAQMKTHRDTSYSDFAEVEGSPHRMLHEIPETMWDYLLESFTIEDVQWFSTKEANHWFLRENPEFSLARTV
jgi:hypothetical protein